MTVRTLTTLLAALLLTSSCGQSPRSATADAQRDEEFRTKAECATAAEQYDRLLRSQVKDTERASYLQEPWVSEVFYSSSRNSCICHASFITKRADEADLSEFLIDCLTRETLATHLTAAPNASEQDQLFKQTEKTLRAASSNP